MQRFRRVIMTEKNCMSFWTRRRRKRSDVYDYIHRDNDRW